MARASPAAPQQFINGHFTWLQFSERVLEEARDPADPLLGRVKFLAITASNLDEFVEVRFAQGREEFGSVPSARPPLKLSLPRNSSTNSA